MKCRICIVFLVSVVLIAAYVCVNNIANERARLERSKLFMLDTLKEGIKSRLDEGNPLPTNWMELSNSVVMQRVMGICEYNHLSSPYEAYTILSPKVPDPWEGGYVFIIQSKSSRWSGLQRGRWALVVDPKPLPKGFPGAEETNRILRVWMVENYLPSEIRSQLSKP